MKPGLSAWLGAARATAAALRPPLAEAVTTMPAALATLLCTLPLAPRRGPAVLAVVPSLSLSRSQLDRDLRGLRRPRARQQAQPAREGVAAAWFVLPVRSTDLLRRRLADALAALAEALDPATASRNPAGFVAELERLQQAARPFRSARRLTRRLRRRQPADWADALAACRTDAVRLIEQGATPGRARQAVGQARRALREPEHLLPALQELRRALAE